MGDDFMMKIAITPPEIRSDEASMITAILDAGWDYVHLRHPQASARDIKRIIEDIPQKYHLRLRLHGHFGLVYEFNLGGLHLNSRCPEPPAGYHGPCSRSCHHVNELLKYPECDYLTLSPIFDSVSKPGYQAAFTATQLRSLPQQVKVIALGGVTPDHLQWLSEQPFAGYAVLGYLWNAVDMADLKRRLNEFN